MIRHPPIPTLFPYPTLFRSTLDVINPPPGEVAARISMGSAADVDAAVAAARRAFDGFSQTTRDERLALLDKVLAVYMRRIDEVAQTISLEMGAPLWLSRAAQATVGAGDLKQTLQALRDRSE